MGPKGPFLQANINHSAGAQDLLLQTLAEWQIEVAVVSEPYRVLDRPNWFGDAAGSVAIVLGGRHVPPPADVLARRRGYVAVDWGDVAVVGVYAPPSWSLERFEEFLDPVRSIVVSSRTRSRRR